MRLTTKEYEAGVLSTKRVREILRSPEIVVRELLVDENDYGEFLFLSFENRDHSPVFSEYQWRALTLCGYGYNRLIGRWVSDKWGFYECQFLETETEFTADQVEARLIGRLAELPPHDNATTPLERGIINLGLEGDPDAFQAIMGDLEDELSGERGD